MTYEKKFNPEKLPGGYYLADMEDGTLMLLEVVNEFVSWAGPDRLLISVSYPRQDRYPQENYVLFDLRSFAADAKTLEGKFDEYFGKQFSFNSDGRKWALSLGNTENSPGGSSSNMIVADFPKTEGVTIGQGTWAEYQGPILSPDGNKLIFVNHTPPSGWYTKLWDGKDVKLFTSGRPEMWVDNNSFIMTDVRYDGEKQIYSVYLYDIPSSKETKLY
jgi:hypothetical protein